MIPMEKDMVKENRINEKFVSISSPSRVMIGKIMNSVKTLEEDIVNKTNKEEIP